VRRGGPVRGGLAAAHEGKASRPQSLGLTREVPADLVERDGYVLFDGISGVNGPTSNGPARFTPGDVTRSDVFEEDHAALLPAGARIRRRWNRAGQEFWDYPAGTRLVHRFFCRTTPRRRLCALRLAVQLRVGSL